MAQDQSKRLSKKVVSSDKNSYSNLIAITGFTPIKKDYDVANGAKLSDSVDATRTKEAQLIAAAKAGKDNARDSEWAFHNWVLGAKDQVLAQYGSDSNEYQSLGLKKKSERKRPKRKTISKTTTK